MLIDICYIPNLSRDFYNEGVLECEEMILRVLSCSLFIWQFMHHSAFPASLEFGTYFIVVDDLYIGFLDSL